MADYASVNGTIADNIQSVGGVVKSSIASIGGLLTPAGGATFWVLGLDDSFAAFAENSDLTSWTVYDARSTSATPDYWRVCFGKDGSGNPLWVGTWLADNAEVCYTSDPTDSNVWTAVQNDSSGGNLRNRKFALEWGNDVWIAIGAQTASYKNYFRSTDGQSWTQHDCTSLTDFDTTNIYSLTTDSNGTWWFGQGCRIYKSTDDGANFSLHHTLTGCGEIDDMCFTNDTLVLLCNSKLYAAAASDTTDWSAATTFSSSGIRIAGANGRVIFTGNSKYAKYADVDGKTITTDNTTGVALPTDGGDKNGDCVATDGTTWVIGRETGDVCKSTDNGETWVHCVAGLGSGGKDVVSVRCDVLLPL